MLRIRDRKGLGRSGREHWIAAKTQAISKAGPLHNPRQHLSFLRPWLWDGAGLPYRCPVFGQFSAEL